MWLISQFVRTNRTDGTGQTVTCTRTVVHYYSMIITVGLPRGDIGGDILVLNKSSPDITPTQTEDITDWQLPKYLFIWSIWITVGVVRELINYDCNNDDVTSLTSSVVNLVLVRVHVNSPIVQCSPDESLTYPISKNMWFLDLKYQSVLVL